MDPASIARLAITEVALGGMFGTRRSFLWHHLENELNQSLDDALKQAIWTWIAADPRISVEDKPQTPEAASVYLDPDNSREPSSDKLNSKNEPKLFASADLQWKTLTGSPQLDNSVGDKAFEVLCLIAHHRAVGCSTVRICKETGQDARLLFSRTQTLERAGLVRRFPIIENGAATNLWILTKFSGNYSNNSTSSNVINKTAMYEAIIEYCRSGPQSLQLVRSITHHIGEVLPELKKHRLRPTVMNALKELEGLKCLRRLMVVSSKIPERSYQAMEFVQELPKRVQKSSSIVGVVPFDGIISSVTFDDDEDDVEDDPAIAETSTSQEFDDMKVEIGSTVTVTKVSNCDDNEVPRVKANIIFPLVNQIFDAVKETRTQGISAMDLNRTLTGPKFGKTLPVFLSYLTSQSSKTPVQPPHLEHLSLIKGVDFNRRVKFYRYFAKLYFPQGNYGKNEKEIWGTFRHHKPQQPLKSLLEVEMEYMQPLRLNCMVYQTEDGQIKPVFHGELNNLTNGKIILKSEGGKQSHPSVGTGKKRGRPPKNSSQKNTTSHVEVKSKKDTSPVDEVAIFKSEAAKLATPVHLRSWEGGKLAKEYQVSAYLAPAEYDAPLIPSNAKKSVKQSPTKSSGSNSLGSIAVQQRIDTFMEMLRNQGGVTQGGSQMRAKFDQLTGGESSIDRRTMTNLVNRLMGCGLIKQLAMNVPTSSNKVLLKYIYYDPKLILDTSTDPRVSSIKAEVLEGSNHPLPFAERAAAVASRNSDLPVKEMTVEELNAFNPIPHVGRILTTRSLNHDSSKGKTRFGPSAAETLGVDKSGNPKKVSKRFKKNGEPDVTPRTSEKLPSGVTRIKAKNNENSRSSMDNMLDPMLVNLNTSAAVENPQKQVSVNIDWLARSVIVYKSLNPRRGSSIDWDAIASGIPGLTASNAQSLWSDCRKHLIDTNKHIRSINIVPELMDQFENLFMDAFKRGDIADPRDKGLENLIPELVQFWLTADEQSAIGRKALKAPSESELIINQLEKLNLRPKSQESLDRFSSLQTQASMINAERMLADSAFSVISDPLEKSCISSPETNYTDPEMRLRAVIAADSGDTFKPELAIQELSGFSNEELKLARSGLEQKRVIKWGDADPTKTPMGRPYVLDDSVTQCLAVTKLDVGVIQSAAANMNSLVSTTPSEIDIPATVEDAEVISLIDLSTSGFKDKKVKLARVGEKFGLISSGYKSRDIDKQQFECKMRRSIIDQKAEHTDERIVESSNLHQRNDRVVVEGMPRFISPPMSTNLRRPWIWQTQNLQNDQIWRSIVYKIFSLVLFRPGIATDTVASSLKTAIEVEETKSAIETMVSGGALNRINSVDGLTVSPDWFRYLF